MKNNSTSLRNSDGVEVKENMRSVITDIAKEVKELKKSKKDLIETNEILFSDKTKLKGLNKVLGNEIKELKNIVSSRDSRIARLKTHKDRYKQKIKKLKKKNKKLSDRNLVLSTWYEFYLIRKAALTKKSK